MLEGIGLGREGTTEGLTVLIRDAGVPQRACKVMVAWITRATGWAARAVLIAIVTWIQRTGPRGCLWVGANIRCSRCVLLTKKKRKKNGACIFVQISGAIRSNEYLG